MFLVPDRLQDSIGERPGQGLRLCGLRDNWRGNAAVGRTREMPRDTLPAEQCCFGYKFGADLTAIGQGAGVYKEQSKTQRLFRGNFYAGSYSEKY
jgi:hypothetical protein